MKEFKTSQIQELKKLSKQIYDMADSALSYRASFLEDCGTSEYEYRKRDSLSDPESYYHFKLFDKGVSIIRLYSRSGWFRVDEDKKEFHFAIRCFGFKPSFNLEHRIYQSYIDYGDFKTIKECIKYFIAACVMVTDSEYGIVDPLFKEEYVLV